MITIVGNNFGGNYAGQQLACVETRYYVIVNGNLTVNAQAAAYLAAEVLELQVEGLVMGASAPVAVYAKCEVAGQAYITIVKSWIKDQHTICIEKVPGWASVSSYVLSFQCMYFPLGLDFCPKSISKLNISLNNPPSGVQLFYAMGYATEEWMYLYMQFTNFHVEDPSVPTVLTLNGVPSGAEGTFPLIYNDASLEAMGSGYKNMVLSGGTLTMTEALGTLANESAVRKFLKGFSIFE